MSGDSLNCEKLSNENLNRIIGIFEQERLTRSSFNIPELAGIIYDEVRVCLILSKLLDPKGSHGEDSFFLERFCRTVLNLRENELPDDELKSAAVKKEYSIPDSKRRIDIVIITKRHFIPIEVKITTKDQEMQCFDYRQEACRFQKACGTAEENAAVFYLTPDGRKPSENSSGGLSVSDKYGKGDIRCVSFTDVSCFLSECIKDDRITSVPNVHDCLTQFLCAVDNISERGSWDKIKEIIPNENDREDLSDDRRNCFIEQTFEGFLERHDIQKNDPRMIKEDHFWKYRLSEEICKTPEGQRIGIYITVDVNDQYSAYWGVSLWAEGTVGKDDQDKLLKNDEIRKIIDKKIGEDYGRQNTWIFKETRSKIMHRKSIDLYRLLIGSEMEAFIEEVVCDADIIFYKYGNIDEMNQTEDL